MVQLFVFSSDGQRLALPLAAIQSVLQMMEVSPARDPATGQAGTINLHGRIIPVYSVGCLTGMPDRPPRLTDKLLIASDGEEPVALWIDDTHGVMEMEIVPSIGEDDKSHPLLPGITITESGIAVISDLPVLMAASRNGSLKDAFSRLRDAGSTRPAAQSWQDREEDASVHAILAGRAAKMVRPEPEGSPSEITEILRFQLAYQQYAVEMKYVREVILTGEITPVPGTPDFISGICVIRGHIISLVDLRALFKIPEKGLTDLNRVIVMTDGKITFGILADTISGVGSLVMSRLAAPRPGDLPGGRRYLKGVDDGDLYVLDAAAILGDPGIIIEDA